MKHHYVVFVHGIGEQEPGSYLKLAKAVRTAFEDEVKKRGIGESLKENLIWEEVYWADVTQPDQEVLKEKLELSGFLREFMIGSLGDAIAYSRISVSSNKYEEIQKRFKAVFQKLSHQAKESLSHSVPVTLIAHSLGTVVASDGIYDLYKKGEFPPNLFLANFFSLGSPIALYGLRYGLANFNHPIRPKKWINFYYLKDVIGYPLRILNSAYASAVAEDVALCPGGGANFLVTLLRMIVACIPLAGNLQSHSWYFSDQRVIRRIAESLAEIDNL